MADSNFYQYMLAAFRHKFKHEAATSFPYPGYDLPYETIGDKKGIFYYARNGNTALPRIYTNFPDTKEGNLQMVKKVLENLDRHLDQELNRYFKPTTTPKINIPVVTKAAQKPAIQPTPTVQTIPAGSSAIPPIPTPRVSMPQIIIQQKETIPPVETTPEPVNQPTLPQITNSLQTPLTNMPSAVSSPPSLGRLNPSSLGSSISSIFQKGTNIISQAGPPSKLTSEKIVNSLKEMAKGIGRGITGPGLTGVANLGGRGLLGGANFIGNVSKQASAKGANLTGKAKSRVVVAIIIAFLLFILFSSLSGMNGTTPPGQASPISGGGTYTETNISSCKFTRGAENPTETTFKSTLLLSYIQEASQKSSIPPQVLAAFIRVESPSSSNMTDSGIVNYSSKCAQSDTKALGIMQIQPPGTTSARGDPASCDDCIDAGAKLIGKTVYTMTEQDYCDPRTNIIVGAGWILKKMSKLGYGDGTKWDPVWTNDRKALEALVNTYYGGVLYPDYNTGPFNYATDVSTSIQNCRTPAAVGGGAGKEVAPANATDCPIPNGTIICGSQSTPLNGCGHCGIGYGIAPTKDYCGYAGTKYSLDIAGQDFQPIFLPKIGGNIIIWSYQGEETGKNEAIQRYTGIFSDGFALQTYYLQLHHTQPGSGNSGAQQSGDLGGRICGNGCGEKHVHVQIGSGGDNQNNTGWLDAAAYFCKQ